MFGHDKHDDDKDEEVVQPVSSQPVNEGLLGVDDDDTTGTDDQAADDATEQEETSAPSSTSNDEPSTDELLDIKRQALQELSPLVDHLDQTPEEKFKTTMMMIQASDDKTLIPSAYEAAKDISDDKSRAQALLDIVNEINYFVQKKD
jgi:hypothetical protein